MNFLLFKKFHEKFLKIDKFNPIYSKSNEIETDIQKLYQDFENRINFLKKIADGNRKIKLLHEEFKKYKRYYLGSGFN